METLTFTFKSKFKYRFSSESSLEDQYSYWPNFPNKNENI